MWEFLQFDDVSQQVPYMLWKRFLIEGRDGIKFNFTPQLPHGYGFLLREIMHKGTFYATSNGAAPVIQDKIELLQKLNYTELQSEPYPVDLISTPGWSDVYYHPAPAPVDAGALNVCADCNPPVKNKIILNVFYQHNEAIEVLIQRYNSGFLCHFDLLLFGYLIADKKLAMWR
jgi:hypothetical protein